ncbi:tail fiber domain-containing protein [uncultured Robinsoniella sp.]|uniref:tail fiber domain-containing protein n=1 Tax=uncultured Robinsoniella sp. TaxID=904190 RepID=UPI002045C736|nr:MAG TPA: endosialidase chaperone [Caudoviricetes sp.]
MINTSSEYKNAIRINTKTLIKANITLANKKTISLEGKDFMSGTTRIYDGVSSSGNFDIGSTIINKLNMSLNNMQDEYSTYDFTDAVATVFVGLQLADRVEWLKKGVFNADDPTSTQSIITLECLDNMAKFDKQYDGKLSFPASLQTIVNYCCSKCGVILNTNQFDNYTYRVSKSPFEANEPITYREILSYCAQIAGCYARCNVDGRLELKWYDTTAFPALDDLDGGNLTDYSSGANIDGGNFTNYSSGDSVYGGEFTDKLPYHHIYSLSSINISTDDVVITGISVTAADGKNSKGEEVTGETVLNGDAGYVLKIENNPLIECGMASNVANYLGSKIRGMRFRPMNISALSDPSIEAGDCAVVTDRKNNSYYCYITNLTYTMGGYESFSCDAETPARNSSQRYSEMTKAVVEARKNTQKQLSQYDLAAQQLGSLMANAVGMYETTTVDEADGSMIRYMHDKPELKDSKIIWKQTIDAFAVSTDGGVTWPYGHDKEGNVLATVLTAIGINADWINAGKIKGIEIEGVTITGSTFKNAAGTFEIDNDGLLRSYSKGKKTELSLGDAGITVSGRVPEEPGVRGSYGLRCIDYANKRGAMYNSNGLYMYIDRGAGIELDTVFNVDLVARYMYCYCDATFFYPFTIFNDLYVSGKITTNGLANNSDPRLKNIESQISDAENILKKLETIIFRWKDGDDKKLHMGLNADNVQEVFGDEYGIVSEGREGYKGVSYIEIIPPLVSAVNSHSERINRNEERLDRIEERLDRIEEKLDKLLERM